MEHTRFWIEMSADGIESLAVAIMVGFIVIVTVRWLIHLGRGGHMSITEFLSENPS